MVELIERCLNRDERAWGDFYLMAERVGLRAVRRVLGKYGLAEQEYDVLQEVYWRLLKNDMRRLRSFRGTTTVQLNVWFYRVVLRAAVNCAKRELSKLGRQCPLGTEYDVVESRGPTESQVAAFLGEIARRSQRVGRRLRILAGFEKPARPIAQKTLRDWRQIGFLACD